MGVKHITAVNPLEICYAVASLVLVIWYQNVYVLPKVEYNKLHPYTRLAPSSHRGLAARPSLQSIIPTLASRQDKHLSAFLCSGSKIDPALP